MPTTMTARIASQLERAVFGAAWHGPALLEVLDDVSIDDAAARPLSGAHSIHELAAHAAAWLEIVRQRVEGHPPDVTEDMNWPPLEGNWTRVQRRVGDAARPLAATIRALDDSRLDDSVGGEERAWSVYETLQGAIEHSLYHAGQIAVLKKGLGR